MWWMSRPPSSFLADLHGQFGLPRSLVVDLAARASGGEVVDVRRVVGGYDNEVYRVELADGRSVYPRIRRLGEAGGHGEAWAMSQARQAGVPVPEVLSLTVVATDEGVREAMVVAQAPGRDLESILPSLRPPERFGVMRALGGVLARLHQVSTPGGWRHNDDGSWPDPVQVRCWFLEGRAGDREDLVAAGLDGDEVDHINALLDRFWEPVDPPGRPVLCHGDITPDHVFVDADLRISSLIDWGMWQGGSPAGDLATAAIRNTGGDFAAIVAGHGSGSQDSSTFQRSIAVSLVGHLVGRMAHFQRIGDTGGMAAAVARLRRAVVELEGVAS
jgi:Ser/Thr protein kinase RdoA (MazF antagonist)